MRATHNTLITRRSSLPDGVFECFPRDVFVRLGLPHPRRIQRPYRPPVVRRERRVPEVHDEHHPGCVGSATNILYQNLRMTDVNTTISMITHYPCADVMPGDQCWALFNSTSMKLEIRIENLTAMNSVRALKISMVPMRLGSNTLYAPL